jgi:cell division protein FtsZ
MPKQETLQLDNVSRGRFDKSEPTLYDGENLDVPTFLRRGVSLKR